MNKNIVNYYTIAPMNVKSGDVLICKLVAHVFELDGKLFYKLYRCQSNEEKGSSDIPQGNRIHDADHIVSAIFPTLRIAEVEEEV